MRAAVGWGRRLIGGGCRGNLLRSPPSPACPLLPGPLPNLKWAPASSCACLRLPRCVWLQVHEKMAFSEGRAASPHAFVGPNPVEGAEGASEKKRHMREAGQPITGGWGQGQGYEKRGRACCACCAAAPHPRRQRLPPWPAPPPLPSCRRPEGGPQPGCAEGVTAAQAHQPHRAPRSTASPPCLRPPTTVARAVTPCLMMLLLEKRVTDGLYSRGARRSWYIRMAATQKGWEEGRQHMHSQQRNG